MKNRIGDLVTILLIIMVIGLISWQMIKQNQTDPVEKVSVIVPDSQNDRWKAIREGMDQAAEKYGMKVQFVTTAQWNSSNDLWSRAAEEAESGADAIIINPISKPNDDESKLEQLTSIPFLILGSDMAIGGSYLSVHADDEKIGEMIGQALWDDYGEGLKEMHIGLVSGLQTQTAMQERREGLLRVLGQHDISPAWSLGLSTTLETTLTGQITNPGTETDLLIALGNTETETAVDVILKTGVSIPIYGVGYSEKAVYYLDNETIQCLVLANDFSMGYYSIELLAGEMGLENAQNTAPEFEIRCIHSDEIYKAENQSIMFPLVQ